MPDQPLDARERTELQRPVRRHRAGRPTLCEGWTTLDLAAHLVIRDHDPRPGLVILGGDGSPRSSASSWTARPGLRGAGRGLRGGPPLVPWRLPVLRPLLNENEWFVHHEDVRRWANDQGARTDRPDLDAAEWATVRRLGPLFLRRVDGAGVELVWQVRPGARPPPAGGPRLALFLSGRRGGALIRAGRGVSALARPGSADPGPGRGDRPPRETVAGPVPLRPSGGRTGRHHRSCRGRGRSPSLGRGPVLRHLGRPRVSSSLPSLVRDRAALSMCRGGRARAAGRLGDAVAGHGARCPGVPR